jgi:hypothetical protein
MANISIVKDNLMTRQNYAPYCGNSKCACEPGGCHNPRTKFNGQQFKCPECGWSSQFDIIFINQYKLKWKL